MATDTGSGRDALWVDVAAPTATIEIGAIRWAAAAPPAEEELEWIRTSSRERPTSTSSREPSMTSATTKPGELELVPVQ